MSGIVGIFHRDGSPAEREELSRALAVMARRGPDGSRQWCEGPVALGCAHLRATPSSSDETLPHRDPTCALTIVHDARLDDRSSLVDALGLGARSPEAASDSSLLLAAWRRWGETMVERLLGDFAFAIWDERRKLLFLARDHTGMRMLFVHESPALFAFASEAQALAAVPGVPRRVDPERVADYMLGVVCDPAITFHGAIRRVLPAHAVTVTAEAVGTRRYWDLVLPDASLRGSADDVAEGFRAVLTDAVRDRLAAAGRVGSMLSGGLDSTPLVCVARSLSAPRDRRPFPTFSLVFPRSPECDESAFIAAVVEQGGLEPHSIDADAISPLLGVEEMLQATGEPFHGAPFGYQWATYRASRDAGVGVILDGNGGDGVVCHGYYFLADLLQRGRLVRMLREARGLSRGYGLTAGQFAWRFAVLPSVPRWAHRLRHAVAGRDPELPGSSFVAAPLAERVRLRQRFTEYWHRTPPPRGDREYHLANISESLPKDGLEHAAAAFAIDQRCPYYDRRVIEYCLAVPSHQKLENGLTRMLTRRAFHRELPELVASRRGKATPTVSLVKGLFGPDRARLEELVHDEGAMRYAHLLDLPALRAKTRELIARFASSRAATEVVAAWHEIDQVRKAAVLLTWLPRAGLEV